MVVRRRRRSRSRSNRVRLQAGTNVKQPAAPKNKNKQAQEAEEGDQAEDAAAAGHQERRSRRRRTRRSPTRSPGLLPIGVPNFFIDSFQIPPFLLPIYQAAGIQYDVPWQILAAINEIETDYGRNLSVSTAGAVGWMQFLPSTWKRYAVDANGDGVADPYNPADAIFTAARYLHAAGASANLSQAIFAYNHAGWYVQSVLLRAQLIGGMPKSVVGALTGLVQGHFPVAAPAKYADNAVLKLAKTRVKTANVAVPVTSDPNTTGTSIYAKQGSPVIAVNDGKVVKIGNSAKLGRYVELQDATGNTYTYANLGSIPTLYPVPKPQHLSANSIAKALLAPSAPAPKGPATAGSQQVPPVVSTSQASKEAKTAPLSLPATPVDAGRAPRPPDRARRRHADDQHADGQGAAVRESLAPGLLRRRRQAPGLEQRPAARELPGLLLGRTAPRQEPVHARAAEGGLGRGRRHDPRAARRRDADQCVAPGVHDPAGRQGRAVHRSQADPRRLEAARGDRGLPRRRRRPVLRPRRQEPDDRPDPPDVQGAAPDPRAGRPERRRSTRAAGATSSPARSTGGSSR